MIHNILLADSNCSLLAFHETLLLDAGYRVAVATSTEAILGQLGSTAYSLVIAELGYAGYREKEDLDWIRRARRLRPGTPILILTSNSLAAAHREARALGVWEVRVKPTLWPELLSLVENILEDAYAQRGLRPGHLPGTSAARMETWVETEVE